MTPPVQLLAYRFGADAGFEGQLVGALERVEASGSLRVLDVLFVGRDGESGELFGVNVHGRQAGGIVASLVGFRLDPEERRRSTRRVPAELLEAFGAGLEPGDALAAVLVSHEWARPIEDAVSRMGGSALPGGFVAATSLTDLAREGWSPS